MANTKSTTPTKSKVLQVLIRLPEDVATRFVQVVKLGERNNYFVDLVKRDLDRESNALAKAAMQLTALEMTDKALTAEDALWLNASLSQANDALDDDFDAAEFERQYDYARSQRAVATAL